MEVVRIDDFFREKSSGIKGINDGNEWFKRVLLGASRCLEVETTVKDFEDFGRVFNNGFGVLGNVLGEEFIDVFSELIIMFGALVDGAAEVGKEILVPDEESVIHVADDILVFVT